MKLNGLHAILRGSFALTGGTAVQVAVAFLANLVLVRHLDPAQFGRFAVVQAGAALMLSVVSLRVNTLILRTPADQLTTRRRELLFSVITIETLLALAVVGVWLMLAGHLEPIDLALAASILIVHWTAHDRAFYERDMRFARLAALETGIHVAGHALAVTLVLVGVGAATLYVRELFFALAGLTGLLLLGGLRVYRLRWPSLAEWRETLREARGIWLDSMLENSFQRLSLLAVNAGAGLAGAGMFFQAHRLALVPHQFLMPVVGRVAVTWFGRTEDPRERRRVRSAMLAVIAPVLAVAAWGAWAFADPLVPLVFGQAWAPAAPVLSALAGMIVFLTLFEVLRSYALVAGLTRLLLAARLAQYAGLAWLCLPLLTGEPLVLTRIGHGLSLAFALAFVTLAMLLAWHDRRAA